MAEKLREKEQILEIESEVEEPKKLPVLNRKLVLLGVLIFSFLTVVAIIHKKT